jgi:hypothetical protein
MLFGLINAELSSKEVERMKLYHGINIFVTEGLACGNIFYTLRPTA